MPPPDQERYARKLKEISDRYTTLEDTTIRQMVSALQQLRKDISASLVEAGGFEAYHLRQLQASTGQMLDRFNSQLAAQVRANFGEAYQLGGRGMVEPLQAAGIQGIFHQFDTAQLNAVMDFSADLIQQIDGDMRGKINNQIRLGVLGEQGPFKTMKAITDVLGVKARDLRWGRLKRPEVVKGVAARAEAILRTEMTRVYNLAHHSQAQKTAAEIPEVRKRWIATGDDRTRWSHLNAHIESKAKPIPIDQPFDVGGYKLMFPGDPAGPPQETINCRCRVISVYPEIVGDVDLPLDKDIEKEKDRRDAEKAEKLVRKQTQLQKQQDNLARQEARDIRQRLAKIPEETEKERAAIQEEINQLEAALEPLWQKQMALIDKFSDPQAKKEWERINQIILEESQKILHLHDKRYKSLENSAVRERKLLYVDNPSQVNISRSAIKDKERAKSWENGAAEFQKLVGTGTIDDATIKLRSTPKDRSYYNQFTEDKEVRLSQGAREKTVIHELGHALEALDPEVHRKALEFLDRRTQGDPVEQLSKYGRGYEPHEVTKRDKFDSAYMGKIYESERYGRYATEIVSMGLEKLWDSPARFAKADPNYFDFMYNLLRGR